MTELEKTGNTTRRKRVVAAVCGMLCIVAVMFSLLKEVKAVTVSESAKTGYKDGYFYVTITDEGGKTTRCRISLSRSKNPQYDDVVGTDGRAWDCGMTVDGTNSHSVKLKETSVRTQTDGEGKRSILVFTLTYTQHAWYAYKTYGRTWDTKHPGGRFDPITYTASGTAPLSIPKGIVQKDTQQTITICCHAAHTGVLSFRNSDTYYRSLGEELNITYAKPVYTVRFMNADGIAYCTRNVTCGTAAKAPDKEPSRAGYIFDGWKQKFSCITGNLDVYPVWKEIPKKEYSIRYEPNGGTGSMSMQTAVRDEKVQLTTDTFVRPGYTFCGWSTDCEAVNELYGDKATVTNLADADKTAVLYAVWKKSDASFDTDTLIHDEDMFVGDGKLQGGSGTDYDRYHTDSVYARADEAGKPGYFSRR